VGKLFVLLGRSASGKDKIYGRLLGDASLGLRPLVPATTRPMRAGETDGGTYRFITKAELDALRSAGKIIEERTYRTAQGPWTYATLKEELGDASSLVIGTLESYRAMREYYGEEETVPIYIYVTEKNLLERAMKREGKQEKPDYVELCRRFVADASDYAPEKIEEAGIREMFDNNGDLDECVGRIKARIKGALDEGGGTGDE